MTWIDGVRQVDANSGLPDGVNLGAYSSPLGLGSWKLNHLYDDDGSADKSLTPNGSPIQKANAYLTPEQKFLAFRGGQYVGLSLADTAPFYTTGDFTVVVTMEDLGSLGGADPYRTVFCFRDSPTGQYQWIGSYGEDLEIWHDGVKVFSVPNFFLLEEWATYTFVRVSGVYQVYRNGVQVGGDSPVIAAPSNTIKPLCWFGWGGNYAFANVSQIQFDHTPINAAQAKIISDTLMGVAA